MNDSSQRESPQRRPDRQASREVEIFAARLFKRLPEELAAHLPPAQRLDIAREGLDFFAVRSEPVKIRVRSREFGGQPATVIETAMPDCAFIVDSCREYLHQLDVAVVALLHPIFSVARDADGRIISLEAGSAREQRESYLHIVLEIELGNIAASDLAAELKRRMHEVLAASGDFEQMTARALHICEELALVRELVEVRDFLRWLVNDGFLFLGYERYQVNWVDGAPALEIEAGCGLGVLSEQDAAERKIRTFHTIESLEPGLLFNGPVLIVSKSHLQSHVHRLEPMDDVVLRRTDATGRAIAFDRFIGLFSTKAAAEPAEHIPILRDKLRQLINDERVLPGSHVITGSLDFAAFNSIPKEELFRASLAELRQELSAIIDSFSDTEVRLAVLPDPQRKMVVVMVLLPAGSASPPTCAREFRRRLTRRLDATLVYYHLVLREGYSAHLHFCFTASNPIAVRSPALQAEIAALTRTWSDRLHEHLVRKFGELLMVGRSCFAVATARRFRPTTRRPPKSSAQSTTSSRSRQRWLAEPQASRFAHRRPTPPRHPPS